MKIVQPTSNSWKTCPEIRAGYTTCGKQCRSMNEARWQKGRLQVLLQEENSQHSNFSNSAPGLRSYIGYRTSPTPRNFYPTTYQFRNQARMYDPWSQLLSMPHFLEVGLCTRHSCKPQLRQQITLVLKEITRIAENSQNNYFIASMNNARGYGVTHVDDKVLLEPHISMGKIWILLYSKNNHLILQPDSTWTLICDIGNYEACKYLQKESQHPWVAH